MVLTRYFNKRRLSYKLHIKIQGKVLIVSRSQHKAVQKSSWWWHGFASWEHDSIFMNRQGTCRHDDQLPCSTLNRTTVLLKLLAAAQLSSPGKGFVFLGHLENPTILEQSVTDTSAKQQLHLTKKLDLPYRCLEENRTFTICGSEVIQAKAKLLLTAISKGRLSKKDFVLWPWNNHSCRQ